jgi:glycosyltransferase involved in cell wall biosynthesis
MSGFLRIGVFSYRLPVIGEKRGGIERVAHDIADGLARMGHQVTVWSHDPAPSGAAYTVAPLPWKSFTGSWLGRRVTMGYLGNILALLPGYRDADVILAHGDSLFMPLLGKPLIRIMHGSALSEALAATNPFRFVLQIGIYMQELATALTQRYCVAVSENSRRSNPFIRRSIHNGVDLDLFRPETGSLTREPSILFVGAMGGRKRGDFLLQRFRDEVRPQIPEARLMMVAESGRAEPGVEYHVGPDDRTLAALYRRAWIYASPSTYEGFGLPYLEALAAGTPVIATPNPGSREVLSAGTYGLLVSDAEFGPAMVRLLVDSERRRALSAAGAARAAEFSLSNTIRAYDELVRSVVKRKR